MQTDPTFLNIPEEQARQFLSKNFEAMTIGDLSDGYHTFNELYDHRCVLFLLLMKAYKNAVTEDDLNGSKEKGSPLFPWISRKHDDETEWDGWFIAGLPIEVTDEGVKYITYHLPNKFWQQATKCAYIIWKAPKWDGHTSQDVLERMLNIIKEAS